MLRSTASGPETKDLSTPFSAPSFVPAGSGQVMDNLLSLPGAGQPWQGQVIPAQAPASKSAPPPRTTPLSSTNHATASAYPCEPVICHQRMEVIRVSSHGLPERQDAPQSKDVIARDPRTGAGI